MRCLSTIVLRNNGINDSNVDELEVLFKMNRIKKIDLSQNDIDKAGASTIGKILKTEVTHLTWIE
jgi:Ran GTPase-activating protein (RanGAP) involved in mRNA processing and transport